MTREERPSLVTHHLSLPHSGLGRGQEVLQHPELVFLLAGYESDAASIGIEFQVAEMQSTQKLQERIGSLSMVGVARVDYVTGSGTVAVK